MRGFIYIVKNSTGLCYIGSTRHNIKKRLTQHISSCKTGRGMCSISQLFKEDAPSNCKIELLEEVEYNAPDELRIKEEYYRSSIPCINKKRAYTTIEQKKQYMRDYFKDENNYKKHLQAMRRYVSKQSARVSPSNLP